jgi:polyisoprenoid-binding protein YceI
MKTLRYLAKPRSTNDSEAKLSSSWTLDTGSSEVEFTIKCLGVFVKGSFKGLNGEIFFDGKNSVYSNINASIDVNTLRTGILIRNRILSHSTYFDERKYPQITFRSENITRFGSGYKANGNLIMKGNWRHKTIPFVFEQKGNIGIFKSKFILERLDFDIGKRNSIIANTVKAKLTAIAIKNESIK